MSNRHHLTRAHLYGVFVNYMQYIRELQSPSLSLATAERCVASGWVDLIACARVMLHCWSRSGG